jgi:hypothetical protein
MLGVKDPLSWKFVGEAVEITLPNQVSGNYAWTLKIQQ